MKEIDETLDTFYRGRISIIQKRRGYRFSVDAPLLADFIHTKNRDELLELGTGNGIISLLLSIKPFRHITALEIQESLALLAQRNVRLNHLEDKITVVKGDLRVFEADKKFDIVFSNPPYIEKEKGHLSESEEKSIAKHELKCDIFDIMHKTSELLRRKGRAIFVFPERRKINFIQAVQRYGMNIKAMRFVYPHSGSVPNLFLSECDFFSEKEVILPPLILYDEDGNYTSEAQEIFTGRTHVTTS